MSYPFLSLACGSNLIHLPLLKCREKDGVVGDKKGNQSGINPRARILGQLSYILVVLVMKIRTPALLQRRRLDSLIIFMVVTCTWCVIYHFLNYRIKTNKEQHTGRHQNHLNYCHINPRVKEAQSKYKLGGKHVN